MLANEAPKGLAADQLDVLGIINPHYPNMGNGYRHKNIPAIPAAIRV
jgi:hypothetical protein